MQIRKMLCSDYDSVYNLWSTTPGVGLNDIDDSKAGIKKYLRRNPDTCFVAEKDGRVAGIILSGHDGRRGYIHHAAVAQGEQRHGIGSALVDAALSALEREGINKVALVAYADNEKGNVFWEKQGFITRPDLIYRNKEIVDLIRIDTSNR